MAKTFKAQQIENYLGQKSIQRSYDFDVDFIMRTQGELLKRFDKIPGRRPFGFATGIALPVRSNVGTTL